MSQAIPADSGAAEGAHAPAPTPHVSATSHGGVVPLLRIFGLGMAAITLMFLFSNYLNFWHDWPGVPALVAGNGGTLGMIQLGLYLVPCLAVIAYVIRTPDRAIHLDGEALNALTAYLIRAAFWGVLLIGLVDMIISFLRVEGFLVGIVGEQLAEDLGRSSYRGNMVHYPLLAVSMVIAAFTRSLGFTWLALLIVVAELQIVLARFVFSYEQAFMADLVRFWYGALFLFASPYTLIAEGHVRVDILYAGFTDRGKAWTNCVGSVLLGTPLCWIILGMGMWTKSNAITGPLLSFEVTQAGFGLYVKYLLAAFLMVFAVTMMIQFMGYLLTNAAVLLGAGDRDTHHDEHVEPDGI